MANNLSKSKYTRFCQCPKMLWLDKNKPEKAVLDESLERRFAEGTRVGDLAKSYFGKYVETLKAFETPNIPLMLKKTKVFVSAGAQTICEAAFSAGGCYCAVDILHRENGGYAIYEVKSSTKVSEVYIWDVAYQKYVLEKAGVKVTGAFVMHVNNRYVRDGDIDIHKLFVAEDVSGQVGTYYPHVEGLIARAKQTLSCAEEPAVRLGGQCKSPYDCAYWQYCSKEVYSVPELSVFDLYRIGFEKACGLYNDGIVTFRDVINSGTKLNNTQKMQVAEAEVKDKNAVKEFLDKLWTPLYFLDFETFQTCIPLYDGLSPYRQVPFQYSLHYFNGEVEEGKDKIGHKEFLAEEGKDPRRVLAERLTDDIPANACVLAYNKSFECGRIAELAEDFPDLRDRLLAIKENIFDLLDVFRQGYVYNKEMGGSFSIKSVLPALFPDVPGLNYKNLEGVHNGTEATDAYLGLPELSPEEREIKRRELLEYCKLDTLAMVKIWQRLKEIVCE